jgi:N-acetylglucosaminyl-diphospho-decaprenol L-rhamnosyltransferase
LGADTRECAIVVVSYNSARHIEALLDSVPAAAPGRPARCLVVDNGSTDGTVAILRARGDVTVVEAGENLGYAGAINLARKLITHAGPCVILNPDLVLEAGALARLYQALDAPGVGIAVPKVLNGDGSLYPSLRREPSPVRALGDALFGRHLPRRPGWLSETIWDRRVYDSGRDVAWGGGAALAVSQACGDAVGDWDEGRFFLYSEDTDFAARARAHGYRIRYVPEARIRHEGGGSGRSPELAALMAVNRVRYYEKYHRHPSTSCFRAVVALHHLLRVTDHRSRVALRAVVRRSAWPDLPGSR